MADDDWTMGELAAADKYEPMPVSGNVIDRRSFVPVPFEQPSDEEMFRYELQKKMLGNEPLGRGPPMDDEPMLPGEPPPPLSLEPMPEPTGDDELDDARGGLRPMTREELDAFDAQMRMSITGPRSQNAVEYRPDMHGLRQSAVDRLGAMKLESMGLLPPPEGLRPATRTPQANFDDYLMRRQQWLPKINDDRIAPAYPGEIFDVGGRR